MPLQFTGKERDVETGLDYFGARYLSSAQGMFTSADEPLVDQNTAEPQSWNLYGYVRNNPLIFSDPTGNDCVYLNSSGTDLGSIDNQSTSKQCGKTGGYWVDGTVTQARFAYGSLMLTGTTNGEDRTSASYALGPDPAQQLAAWPGWNATATVVNGLGMATAAIMRGNLAGMAYAAIAGGPAIYSLGIAAGPLIPAVPSALEKLQKVGMTLEQANAMIKSPTTQKLVDNLHGGNFNVLENVGGKVVRVTLDPEGQRIISAGLMRANSVTNGIASGRYTPVEK